MPQVHFVSRTARAADLLMFPRPSLCSQLAISSARQADLRQVYAASVIFQNRTRDFLAAPDPNSATKMNDGRTQICLARVRGSKQLYTAWGFIFSSTS